MHMYCAVNEPLNPAVLEDYGGGRGLVALVHSKMQYAFFENTYYVFSGF